MVENDYFVCIGWEKSIREVLPLCCSLGNDLSDSEREYFIQKITVAGCLGYRISIDRYTQDLSVEKRCRVIAGEKTYTKLAQELQTNEDKLYDSLLHFCCYDLDKVKALVSAIALLTRFKEIADGIKGARPPVKSIVVPPVESAHVDFPRQPSLMARKKTKPSMDKATFKKCLKKPINISDDVTVTNLGEVIDVLKEIKEKIPTGETIFDSTFRAFTHIKEPETAPAGEKKKRNRIKPEKFYEAIRLHIDEKMPQSEAEKKCGLWQGALSSGKWKKILMDALREVSRIKTRTVSDDVGNDFLYKQAR